MAAQHTYTWRQDDSRWHVAGRYLNQSGYPSVSVFADQIAAANPQIKDWLAVPENATITLPFMTP